MGLRLGCFFMYAYFFQEITVRVLFNYCKTSMLGFLLLFIFFTIKKNCIKRKTKKLCTRRKRISRFLGIYRFWYWFFFFFLVFIKKIANSLEKKGANLWYTGGYTYSTNQTRTYEIGFFIEAIKPLYYQTS